MTSPTDNASHDSSHAGHGHDADHGHDQFTVPPFVPENSGHDWFLGFMAGFTAIGIVALMVYWAGLPLANVQPESKVQIEQSAENAKPAP